MDNEMEHEREFGFTGVFRVSMTVISWVAVRELKLGYN